jgi:hypothetical protein
MKNSIKKVLLGLLLATTAISAHAATVFSDNFDANALSLNSTPTGWTVTDGTVDTIGDYNYFDFLPGNGRYIDLDGSTFDAGVLSKVFSLTAGTKYTVSFDLAGNRRGAGDDVVNVNFGTTGTTYTLNSTDGFANHSLVFLPASSGNYTLSFGDTGFDNQGALLDNVVVNSVVPVPAAIWLFGSGLAGLIAAKRKKNTV